MRHFAFLIVLALATALWAERQPLERYQSIIDRQMFGPLPPDFDPEKMPSEVKGGGGSADRQMTQEQEKLQASVRFSGIRVSPENEVFVSFSDIADPKNPRSYYMKVGETSGGWTVLEADPVKATMTVAKDDVEVSLTIGGTSGGAAGKDGAGSAKAAGGGAPAGRGPLNSGLLGGSLRNRRMLRQQREAEANREAEAKRQAEAAQREAEREQEKAQREAEREEQRRQLQAIQEELRKARESRSQGGEGEAKESDGQDES